VEESMSGITVNAVLPGFITGAAIPVIRGADLFVF
jgi:hypothetical protein